jgi:outer membrane lipoprotein-sorting protein
VPTRIFPGLVTLFALAALSWPLHGQTQASQAFELPQLMQQFATVKQANAHFIERKTLHILRAPIMDSGTLTYAAPARLEKSTLTPKPERLLVDGDKLTIEHDGQTQALNLSDYPQIGGFIEGIRATLAGDLATLNRIYAVNLTGTSSAWQLLLQPRDEKMLQIVRSIRLSGSGAHIQRIDTDEGQGDSTDMTIVEDAP